jgi:hypothetical protein
VATVLEHSRHGRGGPEGAVPTGQGRRKFAGATSQQVSHISQKRSGGVDTPGAGPQLQPRGRGTSHLRCFSRGPGKCGPLTLPIPTGPRRAKFGGATSLQGSHIFKNRAGGVDTPGGSQVEPRAPGTAHLRCWKPPSRHRRRKSRNGASSIVTG